MLRFIQCSFSRDSLRQYTTRLLAGCQRIVFLFLTQSKRFSLLQNDQTVSGVSAITAIKRLEREAKHSSPYGAEEVNERTCTLTLSYMPLWHAQGQLYNVTGTLSFVTNISAR
jgi:hypothetical protein